jgi:hypothetical protein
MATIAAIREFLLIVLPLLSKLFQALKDSKVRAVSQELRAAKTPEEKREAARKIADALHST